MSWSSSFTPSALRTPSCPSAPHSPNVRFAPGRLARALSSPSVPAELGLSERPLAADERRRGGRARGARGSTRGHATKTSAMSAGVAQTDVDVALPVALDKVRLDHLAVRASRRAFLVPRRSSSPDRSRPSTSGRQTTACTRTARGSPQHARRAHRPRHRRAPLLAPQRLQTRRRRLRLLRVGVEPARHLRVLAVPQIAEEAADRLVREGDADELLDLVRVLRGRAPPRSRR